MLRSVWFEKHNTWLLKARIQNFQIMKDTLADDVMMKIPADFAVERQRCGPHVYIKQMSEIFKNNTSGYLEYLYNISLRSLKLMHCIFGEYTIHVVLIMRGKQKI